VAGARKKAGRYYAILKDASGKKVEKAVPARTLTEARRLANEMEARH
jgi:hypothetical protein